MKSQIPIPTEFAECVLLAEYLDLLKAQGKIALYSHIPNGTWTPSWKQKRINKQMGVASGVPDYLIITGRGMLFFLEIKRKRGGKVSETQEEWLRVLSGLCEIPALVAHGFSEAKEIVDSLI